MLELNSTRLRTSVEKIKLKVMLEDNTDWS